MNIRSVLLNIFVYYHGLLSDKAAHTKPLIGEITPIQITAQGFPEGNLVRLYIYTVPATLYSGTNTEIRNLHLLRGVTDGINHGTRSEMTTRPLSTWSKNDISSLEIPTSPDATSAFGTELLEMRHDCY